MSWNEVKEKALICCKRHCCICGKSKGLNIEVHHIVPKGSGGPDTFDNAIPLCFDCHSTVGSYNPLHPKGNKYSPKELKQLRDDFYEYVKSHPFEETPHIETTYSTAINDEQNNLAKIVINGDAKVNYIEHVESMTFNS